MGTSLRIEEARRVALDAQGFRDPRPTGRVDIRHLRRVLDRVKLLQIDSVNVLVRSQYLPIYSRIGPYPSDLLDDATHRRRELFEYWAHEASLLPVSTHPEHRWVMRAFAEGRLGRRLREFAQDNRAFVADVERQVTERGALAAGDLDDPGERGGPWWGWADGKSALEWLFAIGRVSVADRRNFTRVYDLTERVIPSEVLDAPALDPEEAIRVLALRSVRALGVGTANDVADYFRMKVGTTRAALDDLVGGGEVVEVDVEGWRGTAFAPADLTVPRRVDARAVVSPFDPLVWHRDRAERLFDFRYRIEIYTPKEKREYGYYVLPFLLGERLVGRVDLKADRAGGRLLAHGAFGELGIDRTEVAEELAAELGDLAAWLGLEEVAVGRRGDLARPLREAVRRAAG